jgi:hypothetical protein
MLRDKGFLAAIQHHNYRAIACFDWRFIGAACATTHGDPYAEFKAVFGPAKPAIAFAIYHSCEVVPTRKMR